MVTPHNVTSRRSADPNVTEMENCLGNRFGYARVSSQSQSLDGQRDALSAAGTTAILEEHVSGKSLEGRSQLALLIDLVQKGDSIVVHRLDRLGRNVRDLINVVQTLRDKGATLEVLEPRLIIGDDLASRILLLSLGLTSEIERDFILERQRGGIARRKQLDRDLPKDQRAYRGRPRSVNADKIRLMAAENYGPSAIAKELGVSRMTVYRYLPRQS